MKKIFATMMATALLAGVALAQHGHGKPAGAGKPATTGLEHAETKANKNGVDNGIENAEAKQAKHKKSKTSKSKKSGKDMKAAPAKK